MGENVEVAGMSANAAPSRAGAGGSAGIGRSVLRKEDRRLLTGNGRYSDDLSLPGQLFGYVLRSPHAHAVIRAIAQRMRLGSRPHDIVARAGGQEFVMLGDEERLAGGG